MDSNLSALIVAKPGPLRDGLLAMLRTLPRVGTVRQAQDAQSALSLVEQHRPALVLLDSSLPADELWPALRQIKATCPGSHCIVLAEDAQQQEQAQSAGADDVLLTGLSAAKLFATIERLRPRQNEKEESL